MSFDALTLLGMSSCLLCGGLLIALVRHNDSSVPRARSNPRTKEGERVDSRP
jgi:hypothetical protein